MTVDFRAILDGGTLPGSTRMLRMIRRVVSEWCLVGERGSGKRERTQIRSKTA